MPRYSISREQVGAGDGGWPHQSRVRTELAAGADKARQDRRQVAGADAVLQRVTLLLCEFAGGDRGVYACDARVRDRTLELVLADAEALRDVPKEVRGRIGRPARSQRRSAAEDDRERSGNCGEPSCAIHADFSLRPGCLLSSFVGESERALRVP
jgi:hypothetical protein